jgi:hypothetical protein
MLHAFSHLPKSLNGLLSTTDNPSIEGYLQRFSNSENIEEVRQVFRSLVSSKLDPEDKICVATNLLKAKEGLLSEYSDIKSRHIRNWLARWRNHSEAARLFESNGPFNVALSLRFRRNYTKKECRRLVKAFFPRLSFHLRDEQLKGFFAWEPDKKPRQKDQSFHFHGALRLNFLPDAETLLRCARLAASETLDYEEKPAIDFKTDPRGRDAVHIVPIYDAKRWINYCTKEAEEPTMTLDAFLGRVFYVKRGIPQFLDDIG